MGKTAGGAAEQRLIVRESMRLPFRGGEWWAVELDALAGQTDLVLEKLRRDMAFARRPSTPSAVAVHLRGTRVTAGLAAALAAELHDGGAAIRRVAVVGLDRRAQRLLKGALRACPAPCAVAFFGDYEKAKEWLIP